MKNLSVAPSKAVPACLDFINQKSFSLILDTITVPSLLLNLSIRDWACCRCTLVLLHGFCTGKAAEPRSGRGNCDTSVT